MIGIIAGTLVKAITILLASSILNVNVTSASMENTLEVGSSVLAWNNTEGEMKFNRYDIVIFYYPLDETQIYIKRIIGLPGDNVEIINGEIFINHDTAPISERYLKEKWEIDNTGYAFQVPKDAYLVLGDNRNRSVDARYWSNLALESGFAAGQAENMSYVKKDKIIAKAILKYNPETEILIYSSDIQ